MKTEEFKRLLVKHTATTANVCVFNNWTHSKVDKVNDAITQKASYIVGFLQAKVEEGLFCKKNECLMIYNLQPVCVRDDLYLCSLDMMVRPLKGTEGSKSKGVPLTLVINGGTGEIGNAAYGLAMIMGKKVQDENETEGQKPLIYGKYNEIYSKQAVINLAKQLNQALDLAPEDLKDKGCQTKEIEPKKQQGVGGAPIHFSFQRIPRSPERAVFRNPLAPIPEVSEEIFHSNKPVLHRLKAIAA